MTKRISSRDLVKPSSASSVPGVTECDAKCDHNAVKYDRRRKVARMLLQERTYTDIASSLGISRQLARKDALVIMKGWRKEISSNADILMSREVKKLSSYECDLQAAFNTLICAEKFSTAGQLYDRIHKCIELRSELLGLRRPKDGVVVQKQSFMIGSVESEGERQVNGKTISITPVDKTEALGTN